MLQNGRLYVKVKSCTLGAHGLYNFSGREARHAQNVR